MEGSGLFSRVSGGDSGDGAHCGEGIEWLVAESVEKDKSDVAYVFLRAGWVGFCKCQMYSEGFAI